MQHMLKMAAHQKLVCSLQSWVVRLHSMMTIERMLMCLCTLRRGDDPPFKLHIFAGAPTGKDCSAACVVTQHLQTSVKDLAFSWRQ